MKFFKRAICILLVACSVLLVADRLRRSPLPEGAGLAVHFLDVGQGDCALVVCDEQYLLIDGGDPAASSTVYTYLKKYGITHLDYIVCTHPHDDHCGGLSGALSFATVSTVLCPVTAHDSRPFRSLEKKLAEQNVSITVPKRGDTFSLGQAEVRVLGPVHKDGAELNDLSLVLRITYGETSFLFMGDAEEAEEADLIRKYRNLDCTVLKVGHHGSSFSSTSAFLKKASPEYAVISVGRDNAYGHPTAEALDRLKLAGSLILRTDLYGDIIFSSDGRTVSYTTTKSQDTYPDTKYSRTPIEGTYIINTNSKKFHLTTCRQAQKISEKNKQFRTADRETLIAEGYSPCGICQP